jgi:ribosomal protein S11
MLKFSKGQGSGRETAIRAIEGAGFDYFNSRYNISSA